MKFLLALLLTILCAVSAAAIESSHLSLLLPQQRHVTLTLSTNTPWTSLEESGDLEHWNSYRVVRPNTELTLPAGASLRFYRARPHEPLPAPPPLGTNDIFAPFRDLVPRVTTILTESPEDGVTVQHLRFSSFEGTSDGGITTNEIFAILARPARNGKKHPGILLAHPGGYYPFEFMAKAWAKRGFYAIFPELPGHADVTRLQSISRAGGKPQGADAFNIAPNARASTIFDSVVAGLLAFNLIASQEDADTNHIAMTGESFGGFTALQLAGILDSRLWRMSSVFGSGYFLVDTAITPLLLGKSEAEQAEWMSQLDPAARLHRVRAASLIYAPSNDFYFRPPSVNRTFEAILSEKYLCFSPNDNHYLGIAGGHPGLDGTVWVTAELPFLLGALSDSQPPWPRPIRVGTAGHTISFDVVGVPAQTAMWAVYSTDTAGQWGTRNWIQVPVRPVRGHYEFEVPPELKRCHWFAWVSFDAGDYGGPPIASVSTEIYLETF